MKKCIMLILVACVLLLPACSGGGSQPTAELPATFTDLPDGGTDIDAPAATLPVSPSDVEENQSGVPTGPIRIMSLKGPTSMGLVKLMEDTETGQAEGDYAFEMVVAADEITARLAKGEADIAAIPANLAATLHARMEGEIVILGINTLSVLQIVENGNSINGFGDLAGKTVYTTGKGTTPEYVLGYLTDVYGMGREDIHIEFKSESTEIVALMQQERDIIALLPQPFVTVAMTQNEDIRIALDMDEAWRAKSEGGIVTGVTVARRSFLEENQEAVNRFLDEQKASAAFINENISQGAALVGKYDIIAEAVAAKAIPHCGITFIEGGEMRSLLEGYYNALFEMNPDSVGGQLPHENIYYTR